MAKNWETKEKIIKLLSKKPLTLTDVSHMLGLAPSTVSQHLSELKQVGAIKETDTQFSKKWIYYEPNKDFNILRYRSAEIRPSPYIKVTLAALLLIFAGLFLITGNRIYQETTPNHISNTSAASNVPSMVPMRVSIPQNPPNGIFSNYTSVELDYIELMITGGVMVILFILMYIYSRKH